MRTRSLYSLTGPALLDPDQLVVATSEAALLGALINGYGDRYGTVESRKAARRKFGYDVAHRLQEALLTVAYETGEFDYEELTFEELARLKIRKDIPPELSAWWHSRVSLVLLRPPVRGWVQPEGRIYTINPISERKLLTSMAEAKLLKIERIYPNREPVATTQWEGKP